MSTPLRGVYLLERHPMKDKRGSFERLYCADDLAAADVKWLPVQVNRSLTRLRGTVRGLHFQYPPYSEAKIVCCVRGAVFDVAADLRKDSPTFGQWHGITLDETNNRSMVIAPGLAHGFQTLSDDCELIYFHSGYYRSEAESGINANDPRLSITWPLPIAELSERDASLPQLTKEFAGLMV